MAGIRGSRRRYRGKSEGEKVKMMDGIWMVDRSLTPGGLELLEVREGE